MSNKSDELQNDNKSNGPGAARQRPQLVQVESKSKFSAGLASPTKPQGLVLGKFIGKGDPNSRRRSSNPKKQLKEPLIGSNPVSKDHSENDFDSCENRSQRQHQIRKINHHIEIGTQTLSAEDVFVSETQQLRSSVRVLAGVVFTMLLVLLILCLQVSSLQTDMELIGD